MKYLGLSETNSFRLETSDTGSLILDQKGKIVGGIVLNENSQHVIVINDVQYKLNDITEKNDAIIVLSNL